MPKVVNIESTPNPDALKFVVNERLLKSGSRSFQDFALAVGDPLASALFSIGHVRSVFYMDRFVTVNKETEAMWSELIDPVCEALEDFQPRPDDEGNLPVSPAGPSQEKLQKIMTLLDQRVRPGLAGDGGGLEVIDFDGQNLRIAYLGACGSCPSALTGTLHFIETLLQAEVDPEIKVLSW